MASAVSLPEVAAFIGPLLAGMGLLGGFAAWIINRASKAMESQIEHVMNITSERIALTNERIANLSSQLVVQGVALEKQGKQLFDIAVTVARLEGALTKESKKDG